MKNGDFYREIYASGIYDPSSSEQISLQLTSDSHLLIEGWIFEHVLGDRIRKGRVRFGATLGNNARFSSECLALLGPDRITFVTIANSVEEVDANWADYLEMASALKSDLRIVTEKGGKLVRKKCSGSAVVGEEPWHALPKPQRFYPVGNIKNERQKAAIEFLLELLDPSELRRLSIKRLMINCFLPDSPLGVAVDVDGILYNSQGTGVVVEMKRKDPDRQGYYGLDINSTYRMLNLCRANGVEYLYIVLNDVITRGRENSPLDLFSNDRRGTLRWRCGLLTRHSQIRFIERQTNSFDGSNKQRVTKSFHESYLSDAGHGLPPDELDFSGET